MSSAVGSKEVARLLHDLTVQLGYSMAARNPELFESLVRLGPAGFTDAVLSAEGIDPESNKHQRKTLFEFVSRRFDLWSSGSS